MLGAPPHGCTVVGPVPPPGGCKVLAGMYVQAPWRLSEMVLTVTAVFSKHSF